MLKACSRLTRALLALALSLSAAAAARAQDSTTTPPGGFTASLFGAGGAPKSDDPEQAEGQQTQPQGALSGGAQQQQGHTPPAPLTAGQKIRRAFRGAFLSPAAYAVPAFNAGITQLGEERLPHKDTGDELADWGSRTARVFATRSTYGVFANGFYPVLFRQDPRYERSRSKGAGRRAAHALSRLFVTRDDDGNLEPNYSRFAGAMTSSALANVWERSTPGRDRIGTKPTFRRFALTFVSGAITNVFFREFGPDIFGIFRR